MLEIEFESCRWITVKSKGFSTGGVNYKVKLFKDNEFILLRFSLKDYEELNKKLIRELYVQSYIKDGYELLNVERFRSERWWE